MSSTTTDRPRLDPAKFSASLIATPGLPHDLTVSGEAVGDYRIEDVKLVRAHHQGAASTLVLDVTAKVGPAENPHPEFERLWPLAFTENPARHDYAEVKIINGHQHFTVRVIEAL